MKPTPTIHTILEFIGRFRPDYARTLRYEIAMMTEDEQEEHVMQALDAIRPTESERIAQATLSNVGAATLSVEDRAVLDSLPAATGKLKEATAKLRAVLEK